MEKATPLMHTHQHYRTPHDYLRIFIKRRWLVLLSFFAIVAFTALLTFTMTPVYRATVQILIERQTPRYLEQPGGAAQYDSGGNEFYQTQYKLLESRALVKKVVEKLNLKINPYYIHIFKELPSTADDAMKQRAEENLIGAVLSGVEVIPVRDSSLVNVCFSSPDPKFATTVVNALAQCYIEQSLELRFAASQEAATWLRVKMSEERKTLEGSEAKLNKYKKEQHIAALEDRESITNQKLEQLNRDLVTAQTHRMETETRFKEVSRGQPISLVLNNSLIQNLKSQEAKLIAEQSELSRKYGEDHPRMIRLANELAATRGKIGAEMSQVVQAVKNDYYMAKAQEENLKAALEAQKTDTQEMSDRIIKYRTLLRDVETNRALYENMLKSLKTTTATENSPATNIRIIYPATVPTKPIRPRKGRNLMLGAAMGLVFGIGLALFMESLDTTLKTPEEVEEWLEVPNLALIPHLDLAPGNPHKESPELVVHHGTQPLASESYRGLRTSILFSTPEQAPRILLITSSLPLEGKSTTAANLATAMAKAEPQVLLVDADLRRPTLHHLFQVPQEPGLSNFLVGDTNELPVVETQVPHLLVVPSGKIPPNPSELLHSARMQEFLTLALEKFGRIVIDSPPLMTVTDAAILATMAEGVLLVVKAETVPRKAVIEARNDLVEVKAPLLGTVLNDVPMHRNGYYYNSYYYRYHSYYTSEDGTRTKTRGSREDSPPQGIVGYLKSRLPFFKDKFSRRT